MDIYLIDGTYELFRCFFAVPSAADVNGQEVGAVRGVLTSVLSMIEGGATHIGVATDHIVESFRNELYPGYKTSEGVAPDSAPVIHEINVRPALLPILFGTSGDNPLVEVLSAAISAAVEILRGHTDPSAHSPGGFSEALASLCFLTCSRIPAQ